MNNHIDRPAGIKRRGRIAATLVAVALSVLAQSTVTRAENFNIGLHFLDEEFESEFQGGVNPTLPCCEVDHTFSPFTITDPSNQMVLDGGLVGWTEEDVRRAVTLAVEDAFRAVDTGDPDTTLRIAIYEGVVPTSLEGRRLNVILGQHQWIAPNLLGFGELGAAFFPGVYPNGSDTALVLLDHIDALADVTYSSSEGAFNAISGTAAHEIGHLFNLVHVAAGTVQPLELMATGPTGLATADRLVVRRFTDEPGSQGPGVSSVSLLVSGIGTVNRTDFNMDDVTNVFGDGTILVANFLKSDALFHEGDVNSDHLVNILGDGIPLVSNLPALDGLFAASSMYNPLTGEVFFSSSGPLILSLESSGGNLVGPDVDGLTTFGGLEDTSQGSQWIGWLDIDGFDLNHNSAGLLLAPGTPVEDLTFSYQVSGGDPIVGSISLVPEPSSIVLAALALVGLLAHGRRRA